MLSYKYLLPNPGFFFYIYYDANSGLLWVNLIGILIKSEKSVNLQHNLLVRNTLQCVNILKTDGSCSFI